MNNATTNPTNLYRAQLAQRSTDLVTNLVPSDAFMRKLAADESWIKTLKTKLLTMACNLEPTASGEGFKEALNHDYSAQRPTEMIQKMKLRIHVSETRFEEDITSEHRNHRDDHYFDLLSTGRRYELVEHMDNLAELLEEGVDDGQPPMRLRSMMGRGIERADVDEVRRGDQMRIGPERAKFEFIKNLCGQTMKVSPYCHHPAYRFVHGRNVDYVTLAFGAIGSIWCELTLHLKPSWVDSVATEPPLPDLMPPPELPADDDVNEVLYYKQHPPNYSPRITLMLHLGKAFAQGMHDEFMRLLSIMRTNALGRWKMAIERSPRGRQRLVTN